jgi:hypothetical protein
VEVTLLFPKKAETLTAVQAVLSFPELKVVKPSETRWLSHERCVQATRKELPALIVTLQQLYETSGDAEAYELVSLLARVSGVVSIHLHSEVLSVLACLNLFMQRKAADFSKVSIVLKKALDQLKCPQERGADWCSLAAVAISDIEAKHGIAISKTARTRGTPATTVEEFCVHVAIPYVDALVSNINTRFSDEVVKILTSSSIFNPALLPESETQLSAYGALQVKTLADFYGNEATIKFESTTYTSPAILNKDELLSEWPMFKRAFFQEKKAMSSNSATDVLMQEMKSKMESTYSATFPEIFKLMNIVLVVPVGTASVEHSFSQMKMIKTRLRNRLADVNLARLMRIAIEGPELADVNFNEIISVFNRLWAIDANWRRIRNVRYRRLASKPFSSRFSCIALGYYAGLWLAADRRY